MGNKENKMVFDEQFIANCIQEMKDLQNVLNLDTNGPEWTQGVNKYNKLIDWFLCMMMESSEAIESTPYKHWKNIDKETDWENIRIELTDIWHFMLSQFITDEYDNQHVAEIITNTYNNFSKHPVKIVEDYKVFIKIAKEMTFLASADINSFSFEVLGIDAEEFLTNRPSLLTSVFFEACYIADLSFTELYSLYIMKNCLNKFRQDNGYKEGTYVKEWFTKVGLTAEDNVVCQHIWESLEQQNYNELYNALTTHYNEYCI